MQKVYFISGLGADKRVFSFLDLSFCEPVFIDWITPVKGDTLPSYAWRLRQLIPEKNPVVAGISLGGMLAAEMGNSDPQVKAIILASNKTSGEFPAYLRLFKYLPLYKAIPGVALKKMQGLYTYAFGVKDPVKKALLYQIIADADTRFIKWAIGAVLHWNSQALTGNIVQIHGTGDKLLPLRYVKPDYTIEGGSHILTFDKHEEVTALLKKLLAAP